MAITIVGLGPGDPKYLTVEAKQILEDTSHIYIRSSKDPSLGSIPKNIKIQSFDHIYETEHAEGVYARIAKEIIDLAKGGDIVYAVPGDPRVGELSVELILQQAQNSNISVRIVHGMSFFEPLFQLVNYDPFNGIQLIMADELVSQNIPNLNPNVATLITMIIWPVTTSLVYDKLIKVYLPTQQVMIVERAGTSGEKIRVMVLDQLRVEFDIHPLSCLYIPKSETPSFFQAIDIISKMDSPILENIRRNNPMIDFLATLDIDSLGNVLRAAYEELAIYDVSNPAQNVRWKTIQYLIGRFIADPDFRKQYRENSQKALMEYNLSQREQLLLNILGDWDKVVGE